MMKIVSAYDTLYVRSMALFGGRSIYENVLPEDDMNGCIHTGWEQSQQIVAVASYFPKSLDDYKGKGYQLRQMGVLPPFQGKGLGKKLLLNGIKHLISQTGSQYLWCNARRIAYGFYEEMGFQFVSEEFEVPNIGAHKKMIYRLS